jgi:hypothetical protein
MPTSKTYTIGELRKIAVAQVENWGSQVLDREIDPIQYIKSIMLAVEEHFKLRDIVKTNNAVSRFILNGARDSGAFSERYEGQEE